MASEPLATTRSYKVPLLDRSLGGAAINFDMLAFVAIMVLSVIAHLWALDVKAMHHDESIHAWMSWKFFTGRGGFNCGFTPPNSGVEPRNSPVYCYDPVYHGPSLYFATILMYFLFGDGDWQARMPMALAGIGLTASAWMLRPYFGRRGTLIAAVLLAFSPSLLYYTRFARHDGLIVLFEFWMVVGMFRYIDTGKPRYLYLVAAATALAVGTHELYYILFFIFGMFLGIRLLSELTSQRVTYLTLGLGFLVATGIIAIKATAGDLIGERNLISILRGPSLLLFTGLLIGLLAARVWDRTPVVWNRLRTLWRDERPVLYTALAIYAAIYVLLYSTFFAYPRGILDGAYAGLYYWWFTQHEYARGDQPWYYYLMQLPLYEPLAVLAGLLAAFYLFARNIPWRQRAGAPVGIIAGTPPSPSPAPEPAEQSEDAAIGWDEEHDAVHLRAMPTPASADAAQAPAVALGAQRPKAAPAPLFPIFLAFWFFTSIVAFSWAGEKMPWLVVHMALPGNLLAAWALGNMLDGVDWENLRDRRAWLVPPVLTLLLIALAVALWRLGSSADGVEGQARLLQGIVPLLIVGVGIYMLLTLGNLVGSRATLALASATLALLLGVYMIRASWLVNYIHPDVPVEPLVYVQTAPDVPLIVRQITELSIAQTRNNRSNTDAVGGMSMPIVLDSELAWPLEWYLRDMTNIRRQNNDFFKNLTSGQLKADESSDKLVPVVMVYKPNLSQASRTLLEQSYVLQYDTVLNWWFPEGDKCKPQEPGYKRFYFSSSTPASALNAPSPNGCGDAADRTQFNTLLAPIAWPFERANWPTLGRYLLFRTLPEGVTITGREMEVWVRRDLVGAGTGGAAAASMVKLVADRTLATAGSGQAQLKEPRGIATDAAGNVYVADTANHRIEVFKADGSSLRSIGSFGTGDGQLYEPRGVALDKAGNVYVADTWNARVAKFDPQGNFVKAWGKGKADFGDGKRATQTDGTAEGNAKEPLGFFGPRGIAVDGEGNVYIADTGNKRVVVTDSEGTFKYQWGFGGAAPGAFDEPTSLAVDASGKVYVADTWNGRVQVFARDSSGQVSPQPATTWRVVGWRPNTYFDPALTVSPDGQVFASVPEDQAVAWFDQAGKEKLRWGGLGTDTASVNFPSGLAVAPDGTLYVVDRANNRVLHYRLPQ